MIGWRFNNTYSKLPNKFKENITVRAEGEKNFIRGEKINLNYNKDNLHLFNTKEERI